MQIFQYVIIQIYLALLFINPTACGADWHSACVFCFNCTFLVAAVKFTVGRCDLVHKPFLFCSSSTKSKVKLTCFNKRHRPRRKSAYRLGTQALALQTHTPSATWQVRTGIVGKINACLIFRRLAQNLGLNELTEMRDTWSGKSELAVLLFALIVKVAVICLHSRSAGNNFQC